VAEALTGKLAVVWALDFGVWTLHVCRYLGTECMETPYWLTASIDSDGDWIATHPKACICVLFVAVPIEDR
jgi:hypothetical protein